MTWGELSDLYGGPEMWCVATSTAEIPSVLQTKCFFNKSSFFVGINSINFWILFALAIIVLIQFLQIVINIFKK